MKPRSETPRDEGAWNWQARDAVTEAGKLGINAYAVYCGLTHFQGVAALESKRRFSVSYEQLAEHIGCSRGTVRVALDALEKAGLIRRFSGSNGGKQATRNSFFLSSFGRSQYDLGRSPHDRHVRSPRDLPVRSPHDRNREREQLYRAAPSGSGYNREREPKPACPPLRGGSELREPEPESEETAPEIIEKYRRMKALQDELNGINVGIDEK
jgi:DNA-binding Lrp family transcriptional regulator